MPSGINRVDQARFFEHLLCDRVTRDQPAELLERQWFLQQFLQMLAENVVEPSDTIRRQNIELDGKFLLIDGLGFLESKPRRRIHLPAYCAQLLPISPCVVF